MLMGKLDNGYFNIRARKCFKILFYLAVRESRCKIKTQPKATLIILEKKPSLKRIDNLARYIMRYIKIK